MATTVAESPQKKIRKNAAWFEDLVAWIRSSPNGFVLEHSIEYHEQTRTLCSARKIAAGEILFRIPVVASGTTDAELAWYLANCPESISPYLASLPNEISLPRDNPEHDECITGSPVLSHIVLSRKQIRGEFDDLSNDVDGVSWSTFSHYYNAVTSRAFDGPVMVPLLDLSNHSRGLASPKKNVSYEFSKENGVKFATARAAVDIPRSAPLTITYGAQQNAQLYVNYGFCVADNTEPDGSSNDLFDWGEGVTLRMGPRSYTYGPLVKALERVSCSVENRHESDDGSDMEAFLNECEDEEETEFADCYSNSLDEPEVAITTEEELGALRSLHKQLVDRSMKYRLDGKRLGKGKESSVEIERYAAILVRSELKILCFYTFAIYKIEMMLASEPNLQPTSLVDLEPPEVNLFNEQASDLADAYMRIRHPSVRSSASVGASTLKF